MSKSLTLGSFFDGIGGWLLAAKHAGVKPVWASEIDDFPATVSAYHFPQVKQLGDITKINVDELEPTDIICAGSPCQDLSVAGKREGLAGERSGLFRTAIKLVHRLRARTGKPRFFVWENVPGAFSSNHGRDFQAVLAEIGQTDVPMPQSGRWATAGMVRTQTADIAWRVLDAQYWGVPQRRKRIFLVADFATADRCADKILFEPEGVSGNTQAGTGAGEGASGGAEGGARTTVYEICSMNSNSMKSSNPNSGIYKADTSRTLDLNGGTPTCNQGDMIIHASKSYSEIEKAKVTARAGTDHVRGDTPLVAYSFDSKASNSMKSANPHSGCRQTEIAKCLDTTVPNPSKNQGGIAVVCKPGQGYPCVACYDVSHRQDVIRHQEKGTLPCLTARAGTGGNNLPVVHSYCIAGNTIDRQPQNGGNGIGNQEELSYTLNTVDRHAVAECFSQNAYDKFLQGTPLATLKACGGNYGGGSENLIANISPSIGKVRGLTPTECERLQGLPDGYTDIEFNGKPAPDNRRYKALGNGMAQPCADYVIKRIVDTYIGNA